MKKILIGLAMLMMAVGANAASVNLTGANVTSGPGFAVDGGNNNFAVFGATQGAVTEVTIGAELTGMTTGMASFVVENSQDDWSVSVVEDGVSTSVLSGIVANTIQTFNFLMSSSSVYQIIVSGTNAINNYTIAFDFPVEVSEVPLPAAVWLFGSVLLGGLALRRRNKKATMQAVAA